MLNILVYTVWWRDPVPWLFVSFWPESYHDHRSFGGVRFPRACSSKSKILASTFWSCLLLLVDIDGPKAYYRVIIDFRERPTALESGSVIRRLVWYPLTMSAKAWELSLLLQFFVPKSWIPREMIILGNVSDACLLSMSQNLFSATMIKCLPRK